MVLGCTFGRLPSSSFSPGGVCIDPHQFVPARVLSTERREKKTHMCSAILRMLRRKERFRPGGGVRGQPAVRAYKAVKSLFLDRTIRKENSRVKLLRGDGRERTDKTFQHHQSFCLIRSLPQIASLSLSVANGSKVKRGGGDGFSDGAPLTRPTSPGGK